MTEDLFERRVLFVVGRDPLVVAGPGSFPDELMRLAHAQNLTVSAVSPAGSAVQGASADVAATEHEEAALEDGVRLALQRILVSPDFLFRVEVDPNQAAPGAVGKGADER